jgi:hypothetical protein
MSGFKYNKFITIDKEHANVTSITFNVGRYGGLQKTITFDTPVTEHNAISTVENWLSQPMTLEHFNKLKDEQDLFCGGAQFEDGDFESNSDALGDAHFLEELERKNGDVTILCGS